MLTTSFSSRSSSPTRSTRAAQYGSPKYGKSCHTDSAFSICSRLYDMNLLRAQRRRQQVLLNVSILYPIMSTLFCFMRRSWVRSLLIPSVFFFCFANLFYYLSVLLLLLISGRKVMADEDEEILMIEVFRPQLLKMWSASKHGDTDKVCQPSSPLNFLCLPRPLSLLHFFLSFANGISQ